MLRLCFSFYYANTCQVYSVLVCMELSYTCIGIVRRYNKTLLVKYFNTFINICCFYYGKWKTPQVTFAGINVNIYTVWKWLDQQLKWFQSVFVCCLWLFTHLTKLFFTIIRSHYAEVFVSMMAFTVTVAIIGYTNGIIKSPGSAIRSAFGLFLQYWYISLDVVQDFSGKLLFCPLKWFPQQFSGIIIW